MKLKRTITDISYTANQWQLYTCSMKCNRVANTLNSTLKKAINSGMSRQETQKVMEEVMYKYSKYGAYDTEPIGFLLNLLDKIFTD